MGWLQQSPLSLRVGEKGSGHLPLRINSLKPCSPPMLLLMIFIPLKGLLSAVYKPNLEGSYM